MYINLTPHEITILDEAHNVVLRVPPSGMVARVSSARVPFRKLPDGVMVYDTVTGEVDGLPLGGIPASQRWSTCDTFYIVSTLVLAQVRDERGDVLAPGELVRDERGQPIGCIGLSQ